MREPLISLKESRDLLVLDGRIQELVSLVGRTHNVWLEEYGPNHAVLDATARSRIFHCHFYSLARASLDGKRGILFGDDQQQKYISFDQRASLRLKAFGRQLQTRNYPTYHSRGWIKQTALEGMPPFARLELGYRFDLVGLAIRDIFVTHPNGINGIFNDWTWQVYGEPIDSTFGFQRPFDSDAAAGRDEDVYWYDNCAMDA